MLKISTVLFSKRTLLWRKMKSLLKSFEIFCFSWMESSKLINYSANMCQSRQGTSLRASPAVLSM
jgi:hypothetical protein